METKKHFLHVIDMYGKKHTLNPRYVISMSEVDRFVEYKKKGDRGIRIEKRSTQISTADYGGDVEGGLETRSFGVDDPPYAVLSEQLEEIRAFNHSIALPGSNR